MIEVIDNNGNKRMSNVMCGFSYDDNIYVLYLIKRDKDDINVFCSKVIENSEGIKSIDSNFMEEEKILVERVSKRIFNKDSIVNLNKDGISIIKDIDLSKGVNRFDIDSSYIATMKRDDIDVCMMYYDIVKEHKGVIKVNKGEVKRNEGFISNIVVIVFSIMVLGICIYLLIDSIL